MYHRGSALLITLLTLVMIIAAGLIWVVTHRINVMTQPTRLFTITSPQAGQLYHPGDTIQLLASPASGVTLTWINVIGHSVWETTTSSGAISIPIPQTYVGPLKLFVTVLSDTNAQDAADVTVDVEPQASIERIAVEPTTVLLVAPNTSKVFSSTFAQLFVTGSYPNNVKLNITKSTQTLFSSNNPGIVSVNSTGLVTAIAPGSATITVTNNSIITSALVQVNIFPLKGDLNGDGDVTMDDVKIILKALNTTSTGSTDPRDLNYDGRIDMHDVGLEKALCIRTNCAN